jgi:glycosyltransferase involved in cell wall biosynthesis
MTELPRSSISAFVICRDEEAQIRRCLASITWCDEIIVIDSGSTDRTVEICKEYTPLVRHNDWPGYLKQKEFGLSLCTSEWVLNIDADEEVSPELATEIQAILVADRRGEISANGYNLNRLVFFLNRWWNKGGWHPEYRLRLLRRSAASWGGLCPHEKAIVSGHINRCRGDIYHYSFTDLTDFVRRSNTLASNAAASLATLGRTARLSDLLIRPIARFFKFYVIKKGYREGFAGLIVALIEANSTMLKYAKVWEATVVNNRPPPPKPSRG